MGPSQGIFWVADVRSIPHGLFTLLSNRHTVFWKGVETLWIWRRNFWTSKANGAYDLLLIATWVNVIFTNGIVAANTLIRFGTQCWEGNNSAQLFTLWQKQPKHQMDWAQIRVSIKSPNIKNSSLTCSAVYYLIVHGTITASIVSSHSPWVLARRGGIWRLHGILRFKSPIPFHAILRFFGVAESQL